jgi:type IV pilus assembly protein PilC
MEYKYSAMTSDGTTIAGVLVSDSEEKAEQMLWDSGLTVINLSRRLQLPPLYEAVPSLFGVKRRHVINFSRALANLVDAGIPILRALTIQARFGNKAFKAVLQDVISQVEKGNRLSEACAKHPSVFPNFYVFLIRTGEEVGNLSQVLKDTATHMEREEATKSKIKRSLAYPTFVMVLAVAAIVVMMAFVVPALTMMFEEFRAELPLMTRGLINVSNFFEANVWYMLIGIVLVGFLGYVYIRTENGKRRKDRILIKVPIIGQAILKSGLARFCRNLSMLVGAGVTLFDALKLSSETQDNSVLAQAVSDVRTGVADGQLLSQAIISNPVYPDLMGEMIAVGEESGSLEGQLSRVSEFYEEEAERAIAAVTSTLTPMLTIGVGLIIGLIAVTIFSSIYSMVDVLPE